VPELRNYFCCTGIIPGFSQSGGLGLMSAQWIIDGEPQYDMFAWDLARFGDWADKKFTKARVKDQYANRFAIHFPNEERSAGRPARVRPSYDLLKARGAVFGLNCGWEHPLWYAGKTGVTETNGFTRQNWFDPVGTEVRMLRDTAGVIDISNFANYEVQGPGAEHWLNQLFANRMPSLVGRSCLTPLIGVRGGVAGDFTVTKTDDHRYMVVGSGMAERYHQRFFNALPLPGGTTFTNKTDVICGYNVAGPQSRALLQRLTKTDLSTDAFSFMRSQTIDVAGVSCLALRVSFTGDLGWELHCAEADQVKLLEALLNAAQAVGGGPVGSRALGALRIEKGYGSWGRESGPEYWPHEVGLDRLIKLDKDFMNKAAYLSVKQKAPRERLSTFEVDVAHNADASGGEPIFLPDGTPVGRVTSGAFGYSVGKSLALGFIKEGSVQAGQQVEIFILGKPHRAKVLAEAPFDPTGEKLRA
jgi:dimethylglycine dehydrogenase